VLLNSSQIDRQLSLLLQIKKLHIPCVLALNMADEAKQSGISIDTESLAKALQMPVLQISAKYGDGLPKALQAASQIINQNQPATDPQVISQLLQEDNQIEQEMEALIQHHVQIPATLTNNTTDKIDKVCCISGLAYPYFS